MPGVFERGIVFDRGEDVLQAVTVCSGIIHIVRRCIADTKLLRQQDVLFDQLFIVVEVMMIQFDPEILFAKQIDVVFASSTSRLNIST